MKIGIKRVAADTHDIYSRWGLLDPIAAIKEKLGLIVDGKLDDKHRINKDLRPDVYNYSINASGIYQNTATEIATPVQSDNTVKPYTLDITINEKDSDLSAMMNCKPEWCKRMLVVVRKNQQ